MAWFSFLRAKPKPIETRHEAKIEFLGEKNGPTEDDLKKSLVPVLKKYLDVERAYLAVISTDNRKSWSVALCIAPRKDDQDLVREVGELFREMFGRGQFLDMMFVSDQDEHELRGVCPPFYRNENKG